MQVAVTALAVLLGRLLEAQDYAALGERLALLREYDGLPEWEAVRPGRLAAWLERALQLNGRGFLNGIEAYRWFAETVGRPGAAAGSSDWDGCVNECGGGDTLPEPEPAVAFGGPRLPLPAAPADFPPAALDAWELRSPEEPRGAGGRERGAESGPEGLRLRPRDAAGPAGIVAAGPGGSVAAGPAGIVAAGPGGSEPAAPRPCSSDLVAARSRGGLLRRVNWHRAAVVLLALVAGGEALYIAGRHVLAAPGPSPGIVSIQSSPAGAVVRVDGRPAGTAPLRLSLPPGRHQVELVSGERRRLLAVDVAAGAAVSHLVDLPPPAPRGQLSIATEPPGARITVDGEARGVSPLLVADLAPGVHEVVVEDRGRTLRDQVTVEDRGTASLVVPLPGAGAPPPTGCRLTATPSCRSTRTASCSARRAPAGSCCGGPARASLVSEALGFRTSEEVGAAGRTATLEVDPPNGRVDINAAPWAEVLIDGTRVGETPLGGVSVPIEPPHRHLPPPGARREERRVRRSRQQDGAHQHDLRR